MTKVVSLLFVLNEEVTPEIFCRKISDAVSRHGAIRPGECVTTSDGTAAYKAIDPVSVETDMGITVSEVIAEVRPRSRR